MRSCGFGWALPGGVAATAPLMGLVGAKPFGVLMIGAALWMFAVACPAQARTYAAIVIDYGSGAVLHEYRPDRRVFPASLTKLMTLHMLFSAIDEGRYSLDSELPISANAQRQPPSKIGLRAGQTIRVRHAIAALATKSANDVATAVAEALSGSEAAFARAMTAESRRLGMRRTTFQNASGLPNRAQQSTVRDMARLSQVLLQRWPQHYHYFGEHSFRYRGKIYSGHNHLMRRYSGMDGIKTGYIRASGFNLSASAVRNGRRIIAVVVGGRTARSRDRQVAKLLDLGFDVLKSNPPALLAAHPIRPPLHPRLRQTAHARLVSLAVLPSQKPATPSPTARAPDAAVEGVAAGAEDSGNRASDTAGSTGAVDPTGSAGAVVPTSRGFVATMPAVPTDESETVDQPPPQPSTTVTGVPIPPPKPHSTVAALSDRLARGSMWGIQVGAFRTEQESRRALARATRALPTDSVELAEHLETVATGVGTVYRARLYGLDNRQDAKSACDVLEGRGQPCFAVPPRS